MKGLPSRRRRLLVHIGGRVSLTVWRSSRALSHLQRGVEGLLFEALSTEEKMALSPKLYDASPFYRGEGLYDWEDPWLSAELPAPPARILVGGCGSGREIVWLEAQGYEVTSFDPAPGLIELAKQRVSRPDLIFLATFGDLIDVVLGGSVEQPDAARLLARPFDGALLGWGSFGHVLSKDERRQLLSALHALCPAGPILGSSPRALGGRPTRAYRLGQKIGRRLADTPIFNEHLGYLPWAGFLAPLDTHELGAVAHQLKRTLVAHTGAGVDFPHFALRLTEGTTVTEKAQ